MDRIEDFQRRNVNEVIKIAANNAMDKLKKYYKNTDALVYTVSTSMFLFLFIIQYQLYYHLIFSYCFFLVLDPRLKLTYHKNNNWEDKYIKEAREAISKLYQDQYAPVINDAAENDENSDDDLYSHIYKKRRLSSNENELDLYLGTPIVPGEVDILKWWKVNLNL